VRVRVVDVASGTQHAELSSEAVPRSGEMLELGPGDYVVLGATWQDEGGELSATLNVREAELANEVEAALALVGAREEATA